MFLFLVADLTLLTDFLTSGSIEETSQEVIQMNYPQTTLATAAPAASNGYTTSAGASREAPPPPQVAASAPAASPPTVAVQGPSQGPYAAVNPNNINNSVMSEEWSLESYNALHALIAPLNAKRNLGRVQKIRDALSLGNIYVITNVFTANMYRGIGDVEIVNLRDACNLNAK